MLGSARWIAGAALVLGGAGGAQNPHDGHLFWYPAGCFGGDRPGSRPLAEIEGTADRNFWRGVDDDMLLSGSGTLRLRIPIRTTRFGLPRADLVLALEPPGPEPRLTASPFRPGFATLAVNGRPLGAWPLAAAGAGRAALFLVDGAILQELHREGRELVVELGCGNPRTGAANWIHIKRLSLWLTDDRDFLPGLVPGPLVAADPERPAADGPTLAAGMARLLAGDPGGSLRWFAAGDADPDVPGAWRLRRLRRWAEGEIALAAAPTAPAARFHRLGLFAMAVGHFDLAVRAFGQAAARAPESADAHFHLGMALAYRNGDQDEALAAILPHYRRAAALYPREGAAAYRNYVGLFRRLLVGEGAGEAVQGMTVEQMGRMMRRWEACSAIVEAASRGALRPADTVVVHEELFDARSGWDSRPYDRLFRPGEFDCFLKFGGWGASHAGGHDVGPNRTAWVCIGDREWDVMYHEWNHTLDWLMVFAELGKGVPVTHGSDWCGFQPIPSMGMGHISCNRFYMTPGMYRACRGAAAARTPFVDAFRVGPSAPVPELAGKDAVERYQAGRAWVESRPRPEVEIGASVAAARGGWVDLRGLRPDGPAEAVAAAEFFVFSPKRRRVRLWLGADDCLRLWINGRPVHEGRYWAVVRFHERAERDQLATAQTLEEGWNRFTLLVATLAAPPGEETPGAEEDGFGFSLRLCGFDEEPLPGLRWQPERPEGYLDPVPETGPVRHRLAEVAADWTTLLPRLAPADLRVLAGDPGLDVRASAAGVLLVPGGAPPPGPPLLAAEDGGDRRLNNFLNWSPTPREFAALLRCRRDGGSHDLVLLRPEVLELYPDLMGAADRLVGWLAVPHPDFPNGRGVVVLETALGERVPRDEADLLDLGRL